MASVNRAISCPEKISEMYVSEKMSITEISAKTGYALSTVRRCLKITGVLRSIKDALAIAAAKGKLSSSKGCKREFTQSWKDNIRQAKIEYYESRAKGTTVKQSGYLEITRGMHKGRRVHDVVMEERIGRHLRKDEVVHHIDGNKLNNVLSNLALMTRSEHARLHATKANEFRRRNEYGQYM